MAKQTIRGSHAPRTFLGFSRPQEDVIDAGYELKQTLKGKKNPDDEYLIIEVKDHDEKFVILTNADDFLSWAKESGAAMKVKDKWELNDAGFVITVPADSNVTPSISKG